MSRLKSRERFVPNGFTFRQPETNWTAPRNASFETLVNALMAHRLGNPYLAQKHKWRTSHDEVADEVDEFNARVCEQMGWNNFIQSPAGGATPAFFPAGSLFDQSRLGAVAGQVKKIWAGVRTLNDWLDSGDPPVPQAQSAARAAVCAVCPKNVAGDFTKWFTKPAAAAIQLQLGRVADRQLSTTDDAKINVCGACLCPLRLMVHTPLHYKLAHMTEQTIQELDPRCWVISERKA